MKNYRDRIRINPNIRSDGMTVEEVLDDFPDLALTDIQDCFAFAADCDRRLTVIPYEVAV